jgi:hypothetical protein
MRRRPIGQAEPDPGAADDAADHLPIERPAPRATEERLGA